MIKVIIVGARLDGHCGVVKDTLEEIGGHKIIGFLDNTPELKGSNIYGVPILGSSSEIGELNFSDDTFFHIAIGDNIARGAIYDELGKANLKMLTIIHPLAFVSKNTKISDGCYIGPLAIINSGSSIGPVTIINSGAIIEHDNHLGKAVHMAPGVKTAGRVSVGDFSFVGIGSCILPDLKIGYATMIGGGSTIVKDVDSGTTVFGYAARRHSKNIYTDIETEK
jgi:sugar O-acyltransferase (sialic acid O-acetyltransferase NeuD family)